MSCLRFPPWQKMHGMAWKMIGNFISDSCPTWCNMPLPKSRENGSAGLCHWKGVVANFKLNESVSHLWFWTTCWRKGFHIIKRFHFKHCLALTWAGPEADSDNSSTLAAKLMPWLESTLQGLNGGLRRVDNELIIAICNYPAMGVISSSRQHFCLSQITSLAHTFPKSFVAVILLPNRAADLRSGTKPLGF